MTVNHLACYSYSIDRVRTGPGKPGKSWNFILVFSRTGKFWKSVELNSNYEVYGRQ